MWEVSYLIFELKKLQQSSYKLYTRVKVGGSESGSLGKPCTVRRDCG